MANVKIGKTQSITRQFNNEFVLSFLKEKPYSGTELAEKLSLSNATISSILKSFEANGVIRQVKSISNYSKGRKRVMYSFNEDFGLILCISISNYYAIITVADILGNIKKQDEFEVQQYDETAFKDIVLKSKSIVSELGNVEVKEIVVSLPGRVNAQTGELALSTQFDPNLFKEKNFIQKSFSRVFPNSKIYIGNDTNISCVGEIKNGQLKDVKNAIYISIDTGIGGALVVNNELFEGDFGFSGEFGLLSCYQDNKFVYLDDLVSLRCIKEFAIDLTGESLRVRDLGELYKRNDEFKKIVLKSAKILGSALLSMVQVLDIQKIVISGRVRNFGSEYISEVNKVLQNYVYEVNASFSNIQKPEVEGCITTGINHTLAIIAEETHYEK